MTKVRFLFVMTAAGAVRKFFRAEQPMKLGLFMIVPRENDAFGFGGVLRPIKAFSAGPNGAIVLIMYSEQIHKTCYLAYRQVTLLSRQLNFHICTIIT